MRIKGLDTLRFILALVVVLGHGTTPSIATKNVVLDKYINAVLGNSFVGIAAVMAFFIISGFCIHFPYTGTKELKIIEFYIKRLLRIALPAIVAFLIYKWTLNIEMGVIWSLICEIIYYFLYPAVRMAIKNINTLITIAFILSLFISLYTSYSNEEYNGDFHRNGYWVTWAVGLPIWLLGVKLAEVISKDEKIEYKIVTSGEIITYRAIAWLGAFLSSVLRFHVGVAYTFTLLFLSLFLYVWIEKEIVYYYKRTEGKAFIFGGEMSYSLYLTHALIIEMAIELFGKPLDNYVKVGTICISIVASILFYFSIEKPSHTLARRARFQ